MSAGTGLLITVAFLAGMGWGAWYAERTAKKEAADSLKGRISVSMPMDPEDAEATLGLLKDLVRQVKAERAAAPTASEQSKQEAKGCEVCGGTRILAGSECGFCDGKNAEQTVEQWRK